MRVLALVATTVMLSGCGTFDRLLSFEDDTGKTAASSPGEQAVSPISRNSSEPSDRQYRTGAGRFAPLPKPKPQMVSLIEPDALVGLSPDEVHEIIGEPITITDRAPAKIWNYRSRECSADVIFYLDIGSSTFRALTLDLRDSEGKPTNEPRCLGSIQVMNSGS